MNDLDLIETLWATPTPTEAVDAEARHEAPALTGLQRQGDLLLIPVDLLPAGHPARRRALQLLAAVHLDDHPLTLLESEHAHQLTGRAGATWAPAVGTSDQTGASLGVLELPDGATAWLEHTGHHAPLAVGPGRYVVRRQLAHTPTPVRPASDPRPAPEPAQDATPRWRTVWD